MSKVKKTKKPSLIKIISLSELCKKADIKYHKVYFNLNDTFKSLTHQEKASLVNALHDELTPFLKKIGYFIEVHRLKDPEENQSLPPEESQAAQP